MATAISALPAATSVAGTDVVPIVQGGVTKKAAASLFGGGSSSSVTIDVTAAPYNADKTGAVDSRGAMNSAIAAAYAQGGGEVLLPAGTYLWKVGSAGSPGASGNAEIFLKPGVTVRGVYGATTVNIDLSTTASAGYMTQLVSNSGFRNINFVRVTNFSMVFFGTGNGTADGFILDGCRIDGQMDTLNSGGTYAHGFQLGLNATTNLRITNNTLRRLTYPLFQSNPSTATTDCVRVDHNIFELNYSTDLEFNGPHSTMQDLEISNNTFRNSNGVSAGGWFAVGFSNCQDVRVHHNRIINYSGEGVHIEDGSTMVRVDHNYLKSCGKLSHLSYIQVIAYSRDIMIDHNQIDADADTTPVAYVIGVQIGGSGTTEAGNPFIAPQHVHIDGNKIYAGRASGIYSETALKVSITNNRLNSRGGVASGVWTYTASGGTTVAGVTNFGIKLYSGDNTVCIGNTLEGFFYGLAPSDNGVETGGSNWLFGDNNINNSKYGLPLIDAAHGKATGNNISKCVHSIIAGQGAGFAKALAVGGNVAMDCTYPIEISKYIAVATAAASTGSAVSVTVEALLIAVPNGTVFNFTGGGVLTLTAAASRGATTLTGNLATANIASGAAGTATGIPYSTTSAENHITGVASITDYAGAQWPS